jgi:hypothetical protein
MLSFELKKPAAAGQPEELEINCDRDGLRTFLAQLEFLATGRTEHVHLMAASWGGSHLDEVPQDQHHLPIRHVTILLRS